MSRTYLAHHELEGDFIIISLIFIVIVIVIIIITIIIVVIVVVVVVVVIAIISSSGLVQAAGQGTDVSASAHTCSGEEHRRERPAHC